MSSCTIDEDFADRVPPLVHSGNMEVLQSIARHGLDIRFGGQRGLGRLEVHTYPMLDLSGSSVEAVRQEHSEIPYYNLAVVCCPRPVMSVVSARPLNQ